MLGSSMMVIVPFELPFSISRWFCSSRKSSTGIQVALSRFYKLRPKATIKMKNFIKFIRLLKELHYVVYPYNQLIVRYAET